MPLISRAVQFADVWGMHDGDLGFGWWLVMTLGMVAFWGAIIAVVVWLLRGGAGTMPHRSGSGGEPTPQQILARRLAEGSLDLEEYERRRRALDDHAGTRAEDPAGRDR